MTYRLLMFAKSRMDDTAVEQNLGRVGDAVKSLQGLLKVVVVVAAEGCHPGFDFLPRNQLNGLGKHSKGGQAKARTCFRDMTSVHSTCYPAVWCRQASIDCFSYHSTFNGGAMFRLKRDQLTVLLLSPAEVQWPPGLMRAHTVEQISALIKAMFLVECRVAVPRCGGGGGARKQAIVLSAGVKAQVGKPDEGRRSFEGSGRRRQGHGGNLAGGCSRAQVGRPNLRSSASEDKAWLAPHRPS